MKKILIGLVVLLVAAYSGYWFYQASWIEKNFQRATDNLSTRLDILYPGSKVSYADIKVDGFPTSMYVHIKEPELLLVMPDGEIYLKITNRLNLGMRIFKNTFAAEVMGNMISRSKKTGDLAAHELEISYEKYPRLKIVLGNLFQSNKFFWGQDYNTAMKSLMHLDFKTISYSDKGTKVIDKATGNKISSSDEISIELSRNTLWGKTNFDLQIAFLGIERDKENFLIPGVGKLVLDEKLAEIYQKFGKTSLVADISLGIEENKEDSSKVGNANIKIRELQFKSDYFNLAAKGEIHSENEEKIPLGKAELTIENYPNLVTLLVELYNGSLRNVIRQLPEEQKKQVRLLDSTNIEKMNDMVAKMANELNTEKKNASVILQREKDDNFYIGKLTFPDAIMLFQESLEEPRKVPAKKPAPKP